MRGSSCFARCLILCNVTLFSLPPADNPRYLASRAEQRIEMSLASKDLCGLVMQYVDYYIVACVGSVSHSIEAWEVLSTS